MADIDSWALVDNRLKNLKGFYDQIDKTRKRLNLTPYKLIDPKTEEEVPDAINVTENRSATYVSRIIAGLMSSKWQTVVEGEISARAAHKIEVFLDNNIEQADEYLLYQYGMAGLDAWLCNHVCHTSLIGVQWMEFIKDGEYFIHILPCDMRWTPFVLNSWAAPITYRAKDDLMVELEEYRKVAETEKGTAFKMPTVTKLKDVNNEVRDVWFEDRNELWVEKEIVFTQPNPYGKLPFVFVFPPSGFMFRDKGYMDRESPSLLYLNENLYDQISRQLSIDATKGYESLKPAYEYETDNPTGELSVPAPDLGESLERPKGELHQIVPRGDINRAQLASRDEVSRMVDEAAPMSPRAYTQPPSAVEVATEVELLDELQNPRVIALQMFKEQLARLIIDQFLMVGSKEGISAVRAGKRGRQQEFKLQDLKDPDRYFVNYQFMKQNKRIAIVNEARALALWGKAPTLYILRDVLGVEDPDGWIRQMELEEARQADPVIAMFEMAVRYAEEAEDMEDESAADLKKFESMRLVDRGVAMIKQSMQPQQIPEEVNAPQLKRSMGNANALISLLGQQSGPIATPQPKMEAK